MRDRGGRLPENVGRACRSEASSFDASVRAGRSVRENPVPGARDKGVNMRFLMMHRLSEQNSAAWNPSPEFVEKMGAFIQDSMDRDILITAEGVHPSEKGALVRKFGDGAIKATDGPFTEAKEVIGGFALLKFPSRDEAVAYAKTYAALFEGEIEVEVRQVVEFDEIPSA